MFWEEEPRRKPIPKSLERKVLLRSKGKCEICGLDFEKEGVKAHIHHIDGNPKHNVLSNLIVVCPNCHSKLHKYKTVKKEDFWGFVTKKRKLVTIKPEKIKKGKKKPATKKPKTKRVAIRNIFGDVIGYRTIKARKSKTKKTKSKIAKKKTTTKKPKRTAKTRKTKTARTTKGKGRTTKSKKTRKTRKITKRRKKRKKQESIWNLF